MVLLLWLQESDRGSLTSAAFSFTTHANMPVFNNKQDTKSRQDTISIKARWLTSDPKLVFRRRYGYCLKIRSFCQVVEVCLQGNRCGGKCRPRAGHFIGLCSQLWALNKYLVSERFSQLITAWMGLDRPLGGPRADHREASARVYVVCYAPIAPSRACQGPRPLWPQPRHPLCSLFWPESIRISNQNMQT